MSMHELSSNMIYVHPPLAIAGYIFIFIFAALQLFNRYNRKKITRFAGLTAWALTFSGLVSGMFWAQIGWGSYWSWDPKETATLLLFITVSISIATYYEESKLAKWTALAACFFSVITVLVSFIVAGLHSFI
jgi:cytochrome c-type biogenesis protein CcmF